MYNEVSGSLKLSWLDISHFRLRNVNISLHGWKGNAISEF